MKLGAEGALWTNGERRGARAPPRPRPRVDTTGAGDAFAAGLLAARLPRRRAGGGAGRGLRPRRPGGRHARRPAAAPLPEARGIYAREGPLVHGGERFDLAATGIRSTSASFTSLLATVRGVHHRGKR